MNKKILIIILVLIVAVLFAWYAIHALTSKKPVPAGTTTFPVATSTQGSSETIRIPIQNGQYLVTKTFIQNGITIPDTANPGNYLLAGELGYCLPNGKCEAAHTTSFSIFYDQTTSTFSVGLLTEPLGQARKDAESFLRNALGVSSDALCTLNYYVGTTYQVNQQYDAGNLGFSSCAGAVQLPF